MINRNIKCVLALLLLILGGSALARAENASGVSRPNFLWLVSEDNAKHFLQLYNDAGAPHAQHREVSRTGACIRQCIFQFSCMFGGALYPCDGCVRTQDRDAISSSRTKSGVEKRHSNYQ